MKEVTTFVGIDAHKKNLFVARLIGAAPEPVTWQLANEPGAVRRLVRKLEREARGPVRVEMNRRDARKLAEPGRAGPLTVVQPPPPTDEAVRDLARARDDAREDLPRCRHRLGKLLRRRGLRYAVKNWTPAHRRWVDSLTWTHAAERAVVEDYQLAIDHTEARRADLNARLAEIATTTGTTALPTTNVALSSTLV